MAGQGLAEVDICSLALRVLGAKAIQSFSDTVPSAGLMQALYPISRDNLLRSAAWKFAIRRAQLNPLTGTLSLIQFKQTRLELPTGKNLYSEPADCLRILETDQDPSPYKIESMITNASTGAEQLVVVSDQNSLAIRYIARITNTALFDPSFIVALAAHLAMETALAVTGDVKKQEMAAKLASAKIQEARLLGSFDDQYDTYLSTYFTTDTR